MHLPTLFFSMSCCLFIMEQRLLVCTVLPSLSTAPAIPYRPDVDASPTRLPAAALRPPVRATVRTASAAGGVWGRPPPRGGQRQGG